MLFAPPAHRTDLSRGEKNAAEDVPGRNCRVPGKRNESRKSALPQGRAGRISLPPPLLRRGGIRKTHPSGAGPRSGSKMPRGGKFLQNKRKAAAFPPERPKCSSPASRAAGDLIPSPTPCRRRPTRRTPKPAPAPRASARWRCCCFRRQGKPSRTASGTRRDRRSRCP